MLFLLFTGQVLAQEQPAEYLKYREPEPPATSVFTTVVYVFFLIIVFLIVLGLAYFASRILGQRLGRGGPDAGGKIFATIPLGPKNSIHVIEVAGKVLIIGATEQNISFLQEVTDVEEIAKLQKAQIEQNQPLNFSQIFQSQMFSLNEMSNKFSTVFASTSQIDKAQNREKR